MFRYKIGIPTDSLELKGGMFTFEIGMASWVSTDNALVWYLQGTRARFSVTPVEHWFFQDPVAMTSYVV